jgi:signal transduction histidine kinase
MSTMLQRLLGEDLNLVTSLDPSAGYVKTDPGQLEQVIMNVAVNARDAMPNGGSFTIRTENKDLDQCSRPHAWIPPGRYVLLARTDTGSGISREVRARL